MRVALTISSVQSSLQMRFSITLAYRYDACYREMKLNDVFLHTRETNDVIDQASPT